MKTKVMKKVMMTRKAKVNNKQLECLQTALGIGPGFILVGRHQIINVDINNLNTEFSTTGKEKEMTTGRKTGMNTGMTTVKTKVNTKVMTKVMSMGKKTRKTK